LEDVARRTVPPEWSFGGGTALMLQYRLSRDVDIFLHDAQYLTFLSPRLSDAAERVSRSYVETSSFVKLYLDGGEIDFIVSPDLLSSATHPQEVLGVMTKVQLPAEIIAKKMFYRPDDFQVRDVFDAACVLQRESYALNEVRALLAPKQAQLSARVRALAPMYTKEARRLIVEPSHEFSALLQRAPDLLLEWLSDSRS
jgi:hypothetical protein